MTTTMYQVNITTPGREGSHWRAKQQEAFSDATELKSQGYRGTVEGVVLAEQTLKDRLADIFNGNVEGYEAERTVLKEFVPAKAKEAELLEQIEAEAQSEPQE